MPRSILRLLLALSTCAAAKAASAQEIAYAGIPWGTPAEAVRARAEAQGFTLDSVAAAGDHVYRRRADGAWLKAYMQAGRAVGFTVIDPAPRAAVDARFRALADSLEAALGAPALREREEVRWEAALAQVSVEIEFVRGNQVEVRWVGPGWYDEVARRRKLFDLPPPQPGYTIVSVSGVSYVSVDTTVTGRQTAGVLRGRFRIEYGQPVGPEDDRYDAAEYLMEFDCAGRRTRLIERALYLSGQRRHFDAYRTIPWAPPQPGNHYDRGLGAVCRAARR
jgi:hypothetical protein